MDSHHRALELSRASGVARRAAVGALPFVAWPPRARSTRVRTRERALVVEGSRTVAAGLERALSAAGFDVRIAPDAERARAMFAELRPDVVVLDVVLPGRCDGWTLLRTLRHAEDAVPVLVLSAAAAERDKVRGLRLGADDYMAKPIGARELVARVEAVMRRARAARPAIAVEAGSAVLPRPTEVLRVADVTIDAGARTVRRGDRAVTLTRTEFDVLLHLVRRRGHVVGQEELLRVAFARDHDAGSRTVVMHVSTLRRKLGDDAASPGIIHTVWGRGYRVGE